MKTANWLQSGVIYVFLALPASHPCFSKFKSIYQKYIFLHVSFGGIVHSGALPSL